MTDQERKASQAERLLEEIAPFLDAIEADEYEALLRSNDTNAVLEHRLQILAIRELRSKLQAVIISGKQSARKAPAVA